MSSRAKRGELIIIGGHEEKQGERKILTEVCKRAQKGNGCLVLMTVASNLPEELTTEYTKIFKDLGVKDVAAIDIRTRDEAHDPERVELLKHASVVFFTGGDQLRISSQIGDSPIFQTIQELFEKKGATIVGTSAGAAVMPETMLTSGPSEESNKVYALGMSPGLGLIKDVVIDSHFAERGRISRLLSAVAHNPKNLGVGIDEDTAIVVNGDHRLHVIGTGAVYIVDGSTISYSSLSEKNPEGILSIYDIKLHILGANDFYDCTTRKATYGQPDEPQSKSKK